MPEFRLLTLNAMHRQVRLSQGPVVAMEAVQAVRVSEVFAKHCVVLVRRTCEFRHPDFGCSPRAGLALIKASRARAVIRGRDYATPEDLFDLVEDVALHRIRVSYEASAAGHTGAQVLAKDYQLHLI